MAQKYQLQLYKLFRQWENLCSTKYKYFVYIHLVNIDPYDPVVMQ